jgi:hypothetical protein
MSKLWFRRKRYGWGWTPASAEGWIVMVAFLLAMNIYPLLTIAQGRAFSVGTFAGICAFLVLALIVLCYAKGERPEWTWGDRDRK